MSASAHTDVPPSFPGTPAFLPVSLRLGRQSAPPAAPLPLHHSQAVWQTVLAPRASVTLAGDPATLPPFGAGGHFALKTRAFGLVLGLLFAAVVAVW